MGDKKRHPRVAGHARSSADQLIPLLWMITAILALVWMFGSAINIGGWIHLLLFVNAVVLVFNLLTPRGAPALLEAGNQP